MIVNEILIFISKAIATGSLSKLGENFTDSATKRNKKQHLQDEEPHFRCPFCKSTIVYGALVCSKCETKFIYIKTKTIVELKTEFAIFSAILTVVTYVAYVKLVEILKSLNFTIYWYITVFIFCLLFLYLGFYYSSIDKNTDYQYRIKCIHYDKYTQKNEYIVMYFDAKTK